jgi:uncharacterized protein
MGLVAACLPARAREKVCRDRKELAPKHLAQSAILRVSTSTVNAERGQSMSRLSASNDRTNDLRTGRTAIRRHPERGTYDRETVNRILDEALYCHMGFVYDAQPYVIPTIHARIGDRLYVHGAAASRMLRTLSANIPLCVTATLLDGLVLARSAFHHSLNYRSVVLLGNAEEVIDPGQKLRAMEAIVEHMIAGRWNDLRRPNEHEMSLTKVLHIPIEEASAKIRSGPPIDDEADYGLGYWAGEIPYRLTADRPIADPGLPPGIPLPKYIARYHQSASQSGRP